MQEHSQDPGKQPFPWLSILSGAAVMAGIIGFILSLVRHVYWLSILLAGGFLLLLSGILLHEECARERKRSFLFPLLLSAAGVITAVCGILLKTQPEATAAFFNAHAPELVLPLLSAAGFGMIASALTEQKRKLRYCTEQVTAVCTELRHSGKSRAPVYTFSYAGAEHQIAESSYTNFANPAVGETREIYIDPVSLDELYEPIRAKAVRRFTFLFGCCFAALPLFGLFMMHFAR